MTWSSSSMSPQRPSHPTTPTSTSPSSIGSSLPSYEAPMTGFSGDEGEQQEEEEQQQQQQQGEEEEEEEEEVWRVPGHQPGKAAAGPYIVNVAPARGGLVGALQRVFSMVFLFFMSSCYYMVLSAAVYIVLGPLLLGHVTFPALLLALWVTEAYFPSLAYHQVPDVLKKSWVFREVVRYFDMQLIMEERLDTSRQYLFAQYPHGVIPLASFLACHYVADVVPGKQIFCCVHSGIFHLPFVRHVLAAVGAVPATREKIAAIKHRGANCSVVVGGVSEMFLQSDEFQMIKLRKGFIRESLRHGYHLCPMFHYGNDRLYSFVGGADLWRRISKRLPFPCFLAYGLVGPFLPRRNPIVTAVGSPIDPVSLLGLKAGEVVLDPSDHEIDLVYERFKAELSRHYYKHRPHWEKRDLAFVEATAATTTVNAQMASNRVEEEVAYLVHMAAEEVQVVQQQQQQGEGTSSLPPTSTPQ